MRLYNTLTRSKVEFKPLDPANVRMYVCGPTVYDQAHIGNARPMIVFDVLYRLLRHQYGADHVTYVRNITDVDDKINARAAERGISIGELTQATTKIFHEDVAALGCLPPTHEPRATDHITGMIEIIKRLIERRHAYAAQGEVLFSVPSMSDYGKLSRRPLDEMIAGARVEVAANKRNAMDFVLWKPSRADEPGWESPWGRGRPGWHIECSAMSRAFLGEVFDIHGGGIDLVFPHHENEIAQSRCAFGHDVMANVWMHNGFLQVEGQKMSKSTGNFVTISDLLHTDKFGGRRWPGPVLRLAMLKTHYRSPIDFSLKALCESADDLGSWSVLLSNDDSIVEKRKLSRDQGVPPMPHQNILRALSNDLNTPDAIRYLHEIATSCENDRNLKKFFLETLEFLIGIDASKLPSYRQSEALIDSTPEITRSVQPNILNFRASVANNQINSAQSEIEKIQKYGLDVKFDVHSGELYIRGSSNRPDSQMNRKIDARLAARAAKNWAESDRIRDELLAQGIILKDNKDGTTTWELKR